MFDFVYSSNYMYFLTLKGMFESMSKSHSHYFSDVISWIVWFSCASYHWYISLFTSNLMWQILAVVVTAYLITVIAYGVRFINYLIPYILSIFGKKTLYDNQYNIYQVTHDYFRNVKYKTGSYLGTVSVADEYLFSVPDYIASGVKGKSPIIAFTWIIISIPMLLLCAVLFLGVFFFVIGGTLFILKILGYIPFGFITKTIVIIGCFVGIFQITKENPKIYVTAILSLIISSLFLLIYRPNIYFSFARMWVEQIGHMEYKSHGPDMWGYAMVFIFYLSLLEFIRIIISMTYFSWTKQRFKRKYPELYTGDYQPPIDEENEDENTTVKSPPITEIPRIQPT